MTFLPRLRRLALFCVPTIAFLLPGPLWAQDVGEAPCDEGRITRVVIRNGDVFEQRSGDPGFLSFAYDAANLLHVRTTRAFLRKELLFREGDCLDAFLLSESQRLLQAYQFLRAVRITPEEDGAGGHVVYVETQDEWSTKVDVGLTYDNGANLERFQVSETNFLGSGITAEFTHQHRRENRSQTVAFFSPRFLGRADVHLRYGRSPGGNNIGFGVNHRFVGEASDLSARQTYTRSTGHFSYAGTPASGYSHILVPVLNENLTLAAGRRYGEPGKSVIVGASLILDQIRLQGVPEVVYGDDFDGSMPTDGVLPAEAERQLRSRSATRLSVHLGTRRYRYVDMEGLDAIRDVQSVGLGFFAGLSVGRSLGILVPDSIEAHDSYARINGSFGKAVGSSLLHGGMALEASHAGDGWRDILFGAELVAYGRAAWLRNQTLFFRASSAAGWRSTIPFQLTLGGRDGVRSLLDDEFPAGRRLVFVLEDRIRVDWPDWRALDLGITLFGDAGRTWAGDVPFGTSSPWYGSVGFGLRLGFPRGTRSIWRPDIVFPVGSGDRSPIFRVTFELNRIGNGFYTSKLVRSERFSQGPERF